MHVVRPSAICATLGFPDSTATIRAVRVKNEAGTKRGRHPGSRGASRLELVLPVRCARSTRTPSQPQRGPDSKPHDVRRWQLEVGGSEIAFAQSCESVDT
jgi:hypothetical protein